MVNMNEQSRTIIAIHTGDIVGVTIGKNDIRLFRRYR